MRLLIDGAMVWNGTGAPPFPGKVLVEGERIISVAPRSETLAADGADRIDAAGKFLMPGMVEGHAHLSFVDTPRGTALGELPPEDHALLTMDAARKLLAAGFTSACSAAAAKIRLDVAVRDAIDQGMIDGPRLLAASPELTVTGGLGDGRKLHLHQDSFGIAVDGPDEVRRMARLCLREGVDTIKLNISGDAGTESAPSEAAVMTDDEVAAGVDAAHTIGRRVAAHARASVAVKRALRHGVDVIYHCDYADEEALDLLEAAKDRIFTGPAVGLVLARLESLRGDNSAQGRLYLERLKPLYEATCRTHNEMRKRGIRPRPRILRDPLWFLAQRGAAGGDPHRWRDHATRPRAWLGEGRLSRGSAVGRRRPPEGYPHAAGQSALRLHHERRRALLALRRGSTRQARALTAVCVNTQGTKASEIGCPAAANAAQYATLDGFVILFYGCRHERN